MPVSTERPTVGIEHLTVVPENADQDAGPDRPEPRHRGADQRDSEDGQ